MQGLTELMVSDFRKASVTVLKHEAGELLDGRRIDGWQNAFQPVPKNDKKMHHGNCHIEMVGGKENVAEFEQFCVQQRLRFRFDHIDNILQSEYPLEDPGYC